MNAKIGLLSTALVALALSVVVGWRASRIARQIELDRNAVLAAANADELEIRRLEERFEPAAQKRTELETSIVAARSVAKPSKREPAQTVPRDPAKLLARDPTLQTLSISAQRARIATTYGPFIVTRALTNDQVNKLREAEVIRFEQSQDLDAVMLEESLQPNDPVIQSLRKRADDDLQARLADALGDAGADELKHYERTLPARSMAERFAGAAALGDVPLTLQQAEQLTQIMAGAAEASPGGGKIDPSTIDWVKVDTQAQMVLSPAQLALFQLIEPIGGGTSRWLSRLNQTIREATTARR